MSLTACAGFIWAPWGSHQAEIIIKYHDIYIYLTLLNKQGVFIFFIRSFNGEELVGRGGL